MSYDLFFTQPRISRNDFDSYFKRNPNYQVSNGEAIYQNKETGVYFIFRYTETSVFDDEGPVSAASFNLNYFRPHYFGLEAEPEVTKFVETFGFSIEDPQADGMGDGPYSREGFLRGWNKGNEFGYSAILSQGNRAEAILTLPTPRLEAIWRWNMQEDDIQKAMREDIFVPKIFFITANGAFGSAVVWPDAISELIPEVDFLYVERKELAPKPRFGPQVENKVIIPFSDAHNLLAPYQTDEYPLTAYRLPAPRTPAKTHEYVRSLRPSPITVKGIGADKVLNQELMERATKGRQA